MAAAEWWRALPIGQKLMVNGSRAIVTKDGPVLVDSEQYNDYRPKQTQDTTAQLKSIAADDDTTARLANQANESMQLNARAGTGGLYGAPFGIGKVATWLGGQVNPDIQAMDSLSVNMAKNMRAPGQRLTQMEWAKNLTAVPSPANTYGGNAGITQNINNARTMSAAKNSFYQTWARMKGDLSGADPAWLAYQASHFDGSGRFIPDARAGANGAMLARSAQTQQQNDPLGLMQ